MIIQLLMDGKMKTVECNCSYIYGGQKIVNDTEIARIRHYNKDGYVIREIDVKNTSRRFCLQRNIDITGNSGTGIVCEGIQFSDGTCIVHWSKDSNNLQVASTIVYSSIDDVEKVHGHNGSTILLWID